MKRFVFPWKHLPIFAAHFPFLHRAFPTNHDLSTALLLDVLQGVATWPNEKPNKVDLWIFVLRNHHLITNPCGWWFVVSRWFEFRIESHHLSNERMSLLFQFLARAVFTCVKPFPLAVVDGLRRRRPVTRVGRRER